MSFGQARSAEARRALLVRAVVVAFALLLALSGAHARADCIWNSGPFDQITAQVSIANLYGEQQTADDFYVRPQEVCRIDHISATLLGDSILPKARLRIYDDCNGAPGNQLYTLDTTQLTDTGQVYSGFKVYTVRFDPVTLWLQGGPIGRTYWVSIVGVAATTNDQWFWASAGHPAIKGLPGEFRAVNAGFPSWTSVAGMGCGCTDFTLVVDGECCQVLWDGGSPDPTPAGVSSIITGTGGGGGGFDTRAADDFTTFTCLDVSVCFLHAVMYSNCSPMRGQFEIYSNDCALPTGTPLFTAPFSKTRDLGYSVTIGGTSLRAYEVEVYDPAWLLPAGKTYWLSAVGQGGGSLQQRAYFAFSTSPCSSCSTKLNPGAALGPAVSGGTWMSTQQSPGVARDFSFVIGVRAAAGANSQPTCVADFNKDGVLNSLDLFDYLTAWFSGCP
jgi:hypothetical protein